MQDIFNSPVPKIKCMKFLVTVIAVNIETITPSASVNAKPLTTLVPKKYKITQVRTVVIFESKILVNALSNPELIAVNKFLPAF